MVRAGAKHGFGLEVGSKAELAMVMSVLADSPGAILICNGGRLVIVFWGMGDECGGWNGGQGW